MFVATPDRWPPTCSHLKSQDAYLEWIRAFFADDEGDTDDAEEDASHDHRHVHHEPCLGGVAIAAQLLGSVEQRLPLG